MENWIVEQFVVEEGNRHVLPDLHTEAAAREKAASLNATFLLCRYAARPATENEAAQITSLIEASEAWQARCRAEASAEISPL